MAVNAIVANNLVTLAFFDCFKENILANTNLATFPVLAFNRVEVVPGVKVSVSVVNFGVDDSFHGCFLWLVSRFVERIIAKAGSHVLAKSAIATRHVI